MIKDIILRNYLEEFLKTEISSIKGIETLEKEMAQYKEQDQQGPEFLTQFPHRKPHPFYALHYIRFGNKIQALPPSFAIHHAPLFAPLFCEVFRLLRHFFFAFGCAGSGEISCRKNY